MSAAPIIVVSDIVRTTVFSDSAHVVRRAQAALVPGLNRIAIRDLPRHLDPAQIRVSTDQGQVQFVETDDLTWGEPENEPTGAKKKVVACEETVNRQRGQLAALQSELQLIDRIIPGRGLEGTPGPLKPESFLTGLQTLMERRRATLYAARLAEYELQMAQEALLLARELVSARGRTEVSNPQGLVVVGVQCETEAHTQLDLTYTSGWATWRPYYALRLGADATSVELTRFADVWQQTAEDWNDVQLALSSAEPEENLQLPSVPPWILAPNRGFDANARDLYKSKKAKPRPEANRLPPAPSMPMPQGMRRRSVAPPEPVLEAAPMPDLGTAGDEMHDYAQQFEEEGIFAEITSAGISAAQGAVPDFEDEITGAAYGGGGLPPAPPIRPPMPPARISPGESRRPPPDHPDLARLVEQVVPRAASGGINFESVVTGKVTCESGYGRQRISLASTHYETTVQYLLRPALKDHAFARVTVVHDDPHPLLTGPAAIFVDDAYFGNTRLLTTPAGGKLVLDLGAETGIKSARRTKTTVRTEGLITKEDVHAVQITIEVESFLGRSVEIEVQDQIPISDDAKVKVRLLQTRPQCKLDDKTGVLTLTETIAPRSRLEIQINYEIETPRDYKLGQSLGGPA